MSTYSNFDNSNFFVENAPKKIRRSSEQERDASTIPREISPKDGNLSNVFDSSVSTFNVNKQQHDNTSMRRVYTDQTRIFRQESSLSLHSRMSSLSRESLSREQTSSMEGLEESRETNEKSIFRQPMFESNPNNEKETHFEAKGRVPLYESMKEPFTRQVTNEFEKSFDYSLAESYPLDAAAVKDENRSWYTSGHSSVDRCDNTYMSRSRNPTQKDSASYQEFATSPHSEKHLSSDYFDFYEILRGYRQAFTNFSFLLPGLKSSVLQTLHKSSNREIGITSYGSDKSFVLSPYEVIIAKRRLKSAVLAFGGNMTSSIPKLNHNDSSNLSSIFRSKGDDATMTASKTSEEIKYEKQMSLRYFANETRISWDVEESPHVGNGRSEETSDSSIHQSFSMSNTGIDTLKTNDELTSSPSIENSQSEEMETKTDETVNSEVDAKSSNDGPKIRYRCKLCGQPKQNHTCPYQKSLQRSIGTMSYSALNSHESSEPGKLAPSLIEMNNFVNIEEDNVNEAPQPYAITPNKLSLDAAADSFGQSTSLRNNVTESRSLSYKFSHLDSVESTNHNIGSLSSYSNSEYMVSLKGKRRRIAIKSSFGNKASDEMSQDVLFLDKMEIKPQQYRMVSTDSSKSDTSYVYPTIPLTYGQRTCMSDSLFNLTKERSGLTDACAEILRDVKETTWDLAVAELMTQTLVILHCPIGDRTLNGLRRYLLSMGISC
mmetsp:Transcript_10654/g.13484  ORF Transcript_10654/g.13484 Transcript_10654/m.13484 type:complete len:716 (+) Transcript_10654:229-2376(+)